ncbi:g3207 [Coccomyxa elongata]
MVADQEKDVTQGIRNEHDDGFDDADSLSALSGASRFRNQLQQQVWQRATKHAHGSRQSLHATLHSAQSQDTFWDTREEPCASEATVSLGQLPSRQHTRATGLKHASAPHKSQTTEQKGEQTRSQRSGKFTGKAAWSDSDDEEEYQSRCINVKGQPPKRHKPTEQSKHQHNAGVPESPGLPSTATWPAEHDPHLAGFLIAKEKQLGGSLGTHGIQHVRPFHPLPHDLDVEE